MNLTFEQFASRVFTLAKTAITYHNKKQEKLHGSWPEIWTPVESYSQVTRASRLEGERVHVGGTHGSGPYDCIREEHYSTEHEVVELNCLEAILTDVCPNITYLQYRQLVRCMEPKVLESTINEYYGNSSNYRQVVVSLDNLYNALVKIGMIAE